ncbi:hypothetical protein BDV28DRAFT_147816 [Aspergillus coremiiformis]|uniref:Uncharacterized protein n=1 Tax=Aspergillus coremiiformis TaxID=138285 RepID=A0A5N6Z7T3_9EURO|nr:hypothetical protein BDV28DRAFT_147816 [Aspergillus coremiiformis]
MKLNTVLCLVSLCIAETVLGFTLPVALDPIIKAPKQLASRADTTSSPSTPSPVQDTASGPSPSPSVPIPVIPANRGPKCGNQRYPCPYKNLIVSTGENAFIFPGFCGDRTRSILWEFPILRNGQVFRPHSDTGLDRIVLAQSKTQKNMIEYCGTITHDGFGMVTGEFRVCT